MRSARRSYWNPSGVSLGLDNKLLQKASELLRCLSSDFYPIKLILISSYPSFFAQLSCVGANPHPNTPSLIFPLSFPSLALPVSPIMAWSILLAMFSLYSSRCLWLRRGQLSFHLPLQTRPVEVA